MKTKTYTKDKSVRSALRKAGLGHLPYTIMYLDEAGSKGYTALVTVETVEDRDEVVARGFRAKIVPAGSPAPIKYFVVADMEDPHPCYLSDVTEEERAAGFGSKWSWAEKDGSPPADAWFWDNEFEAQQQVELSKQLPHFHYNVYVLPYTEKTAQSAENA